MMLPEVESGHKPQGQGHKKIRGQRQTFRGQTLSRPRTGMLEAKAKDQGHRRKRFSKKRYSTIFSGNLQNFNNSKNSAVLEPKTGQFSKTWGFKAKAKSLTFEIKAKDVLEDSTSGCYYQNQASL